MDRSGARHDGSDILRSIALMHDRGNGLGGGFAAYGIYPEYEELYAFHIMYESDEARRETEAYLDTYFMSEKQERIPTEPVASIKNPPDIWRYFAAPHPMRLAASGLDGPRPLPHQHPRLVGRRASVHAAELVGGAQRRDFQLRREPPLRGAVRLRLRAADRH